jgi:hypothetical protein
MEDREHLTMVRPRRALLLARSAAASLILILLIGLAYFGCVQDTWVEVHPLHPGDMTETELEAWQVELARINEALQEIDNEHEYRRKEYECDSFSDYTAGELTGRCFIVKRAMSYAFEYPDGRTGLHHWLFIIIEVGDREVWVPVECTPPNGERQKQHECGCCDGPDGRCPGMRMVQFPRVADETYHALAMSVLKQGQRFDSRYFGSIIVWDAIAVLECGTPSPEASEPPPHQPCPRDEFIIWIH